MAFVQNGRTKLIFSQIGFSREEQTSGWHSLALRERSDLYLLSAQPSFFIVAGWPDLIKAEGPEQNGSIISSQKGLIVL